MRPFLYGKESLYGLRNKVINNKCYGLNPSVYKQLNELEILKKTRRGCRAGKNKRRPIQVCITNRNYQSHQLENLKSHPRNLINIKPSKGASRENVILRSRIACWNAQSMMNKSADVCDFIINNNLDIFAITEAWQKGDERDHPVFADIIATLPDFQLFNLPRIGPNGGGICVIIRKGYEVKSVSHKFNTFDCLELSISSCERDVFQLFTYRPGSTAPTTQFFEEFSCLIESTTLTSGQLVITGDFNVHMDEPGG